MKYRNIKFYFLIPLIQIAFYVIAYELINYSAHRMGWVNSRGVAWGISVQGYTLKYIAIVLLSNALNYLIPNKVLLISIVSSIAFSSFVFPSLDSYPFRGGTVIVIGVIGIFINYLLLFKYRAAPPPL